MAVAALTSPIDRPKLFDGGRVLAALAGRPDDGPLARLAV
jgi:hypothetical protein